MTTIPQPGDPTKSYTATYDSWNRLVKIVDDSTSNTIATYGYDGVKRRTTQGIYVGGLLDETRHLYYSEPSKWQVVEERIDASTDPERQFVWGLRYVDDLVLRDRDTTVNGTLDERFYGLQDANWNLTSIADTAGAIQERHSYSAYGTPAFLDSSFNSRASSSYDWETLFAGYRFDSAAEIFHVRNRVYHVRNRVYDASVGRWGQRDPLGLIAGVNLYEYVLSSPAMFLDPFGLAIQIPAGVAAAIKAALLRCITGAGMGALTEIIIQYGKCIYSNCRVVRLPVLPPPLGPPWVDFPQGFPWPWDPRCARHRDWCDVGVSGLIGCVANIIFPGGGLFGIWRPGIGIIREAIKQYLKKTLSKFLGKKALNKLCP